MRIVPDTNIVHKGGFNLKAGAWPLVLAAARVGHIRLCVPEVVIAEVVAHYRENVSQSQSWIARGNAALRRVGAEFLARSDVSDAEIDEHVNEYEMWLRRAFSECGEILPIPNVSHSRLLEALLAGRKPFSLGEQKGYRDSLIWFSILEAAKAAPLTFVTDDSKGFVARDGGLATDLLEDLSEAGLPSTRIGLAREILSVISGFFPEDSEGFQRFKAFVDSSQGQAAVKEALDSLFDVEQRVRLHAKAGVLPPWLFNQDIEGVHALKKVRVDSAHPLAHDTFLVLGEIDALAYVGGLAWAGEATFGPSRLWDSPWEVWDTLGDQYYVAHPQPQEVVLDFSMKFRQPSQIDGLYVGQASFLLDELTTAVSYPRSAVPARGSTLLEHARWLEAETARLEQLTTREYLWAMGDRNFLDDVRTQLELLEPAVEQHLNPIQSVPLAPDNLRSALEDRAGVRAFRASLRGLIDRLEAAGSPPE